jgi:hypothetical protein
MLMKEPAERSAKWNSWVKYNNNPVSAQYANMNRQQFVLMKNVRVVLS